MAETGDYQPLPQPDPITSTQETGNLECIGNLITSLVEQQTHSEGRADTNERGLYNPQEVQVYNLLMDLQIAAPPLWRHTVGNVASAYGSLVYERLPVSKQVLILSAARGDQEARGTDLVLTDEEGGILKNIAHAVGVDYDPGTAETPEKRTFPLANIESKAPERSTLNPIEARLLDIGRT